jgi:acyl transferase domain-containing protein
MDAAVARFADAVRGVERHAPSIPFISNMTGTWITPEQAVDPEYWASHIRQPVRFGDGAATLLAEGDRLLLEVGPGNTLSALVRQQPGAAASVVVSSLRHPQQDVAGLTTVVGALGRLWAAGATVDWQRYYAAEQRRRVPLPTYPFERTRFWIEPDKLTRKRVALQIGLLQREDRAEWFHTLSWRRSSLPLGARSAGATGRALVFESDAAFSGSLADALARSGREVLRVKAGAGFAQAAEGAWTIDPRSSEDFAQLVRAITASGAFPDLVVHGWTLGGGTGERDQEAVDAIQDRGFYSLVNLAQALGKAGITSPIQLAIVTDGVYDVLGGEPLSPEKATVIGPSRVIPAEFPNISCRHIDLSIADVARNDDATATATAREMLSAGREPSVTYRNGRRWVQTCEGVRFEPLTEANPRLREGGVYFLTGGFGGIGLVLAEHLATKYHARLVLTSRRALPAREQWDAILGATPDAPDARRIRAVRGLEALGAEVMTGAADVADEAATRAVVAEALQRFGRIDGVIHAAGVAGGGVIQLKKRAVAAAVLAPKVHGSRVLARVFADQKLDFLLLCSSMASLVGGFGQVDYCAANAYLDTFAHQYTQQTGTFAVAVNWNAWREVGMAVDTSVPEDVRESLRGAMLSSGITNAEGIEAFERILALAAENQVAVSPNDLAMLGLAAALPDDEKLAAPAAGASDAPSAAPSARSSTYHPRPPLPTPYAAPSSDAEKTICGVWQDLLGIEPVGVNDNFFDLGGHSLLAVRVMMQVNQILKTDIPVAKLYDGLTVAFLAGLVEPAGQEARSEQEQQSDEQRRDRARRQREQQARRRGMREMTRT